MWEYFSKAFKISRVLAASACHKNFLRAELVTLGKLNFPLPLRLSGTSTTVWGRALQTVSGGRGTRHG